VTLKPEETIQADIVKTLRRANILVFSIPNEAAGRINTKAGLSKIAKLKATGLLPGAADLVVVLPNKVFFLETKTKKGRQSDNQKAFQSRVEELGYTYAVVRSLDEALTAIGFKDLGWNPVPWIEGTLRGLD
jgi:hypothetical protein